MKSIDYTPAPANLLPRPLPRRVDPLQLVTDSPLYARLGILLFLAMAPTFAAAWLDDRMLHGVSVWQKPLKFEFALGVYLLTLAFFARYVPVSVRESRANRFFEIIVALAVIGEIVWIGAAAYLGIASHFNTQEPFFVLLYPVMGLMATILTSATAVQAYAIRNNRQTRLPPALKVGIVLGLALTLPLTLISAGYMSSIGSHWVGGVASDAGGLNLMGWVRDGGDLRVAHFFATHAMHSVPAFALVSAYVFGANNRRPVMMFAVVYVVFVAGVFLQALAGRPFI
ncbi:MAG: hypothetical protein RIC18_18560 [Hoeflea sp.]|uniref:hypothetical protein n=1 Tax=Hoeflea sp. TaxID=1940281 RepID=UPI0032EDC717